MLDENERWQSVDRHLREALEPDKHTVDRVVREALRSAGARRRGLITRGQVLVPLAVVLMLALTLWIVRPRPTAAPAAVARIENSGELVMYRPGGGQSIVIRAGVSRPVRSGSLIIMMRR